MNWSALRSNRCPKDNKMLQWDQYALGLSCKCGFFITQEKMKKICASPSFYEQKRIGEEDNDEIF